MTLKKGEPERNELMWERLLRKPTYKCIIDVPSPSPRLSVLPQPEGATPR